MSAAEEPQPAEETSAEEREPPTPRQAEPSDEERAQAALAKLKSEHESKRAEIEKAREQLKPRGVQAERLEAIAHGMINAEGKSIEELREMRRQLDAWTATLDGDSVGGRVAHH